MTGRRLPPVGEPGASLASRRALRFTGHLAVLPASRPRAGWGDAFQAMAAHGDDALLEESTATKWERSEWEW